ncbi:MAG TPA: hypothetical protein VK742_14870 [Candidatus Sulfotelmatobacter sp.]|jgi:hypothetical protein|nr:hypothetical protein [Candidatus Sulfotelmatobacter sp.]
MTDKTIFWKAGALMLPGVACNRKTPVAPRPEFEVMMAVPANVPIYKEWIGIKPVCLAF